MFDMSQLREMLGSTGAFPGIMPVAVLNNPPRAAGGRNVWGQHPRRRHRRRWVAAGAAAPSVAARSASLCVCPSTPCPSAANAQRMWRGWATRLRWRRSTCRRRTFAPARCSRPHAWRSRSVSQYRPGRGRGAVGRGWCTLACKPWNLGAGASPEPRRRCRFPRRRTVRWRTRRSAQRSAQPPRWASPASARRPTMCWRRRRLTRSGRWSCTGWERSSACRRAGAC